MRPELLAMLLSLAAGAQRSVDVAIERGLEANSDAPVTEWLRTHPSAPTRDEALSWLAERALDREDFEGARRLYREAAQVHPGSEISNHGLKRGADLDLAAHRYREALAAYRRLAGSSDEHWRELGQDGLERARGAWLRFWLYVAVAALLALLTLWRTARAVGARKLWPIPEEALTLLPLSALLILGAAGHEPDEKGAILSLAFGAFALAWANGAFWRARPPAGRRRGLEALLAVAQATGLLYVVIMANGLWEKVADTIMGGAEP